MHLTKKFFWKSYLVFYGAITFSQLASLLIPSSGVNTYYRILIAFNKGYLLYFGYNIASVLFNILSLLIIYYYLHGQRKGPRFFWQALFFMRLWGEFTGHTYEIQYLKAQYFDNAPVTIISVCLLISVIIPSYYVHWKYAFKKSTQDSS